MSVQNERREASEDGRATEHWRRLLLLAKHWIFAVSSVFKGWEGDMSKMSCDMGTEPLAGR
ncbi:MAG: hypothetical protein A2Z20_07335 [Bdellovibrionales bacterium RBG_16_40_8]|nr:MAG: hypothetical protein A2Z20_07335 [Bdellovibrionales bacterium RBG_16_40_8]